jgi:hemin uptake protein HemP
VPGRAGREVGAQIEGFEIEQSCIANKNDSHYSRDMPEKPFSPDTAPRPRTRTHAANQGGASGQDAMVRRRYISEQLFGDNNEVEIQHGASIYRLRLTSLGKLILTK